MNEAITDRAPRGIAFRVSLLGMVILAATSIAGCAHGSASGPTGVPVGHATMAATMAAPAAPPATADMREAAWASRPAYTRTNTATEEAYHYALAHPSVVEWMPCYCGCGAMGHGSNLDCYLKPQPDSSIVYEEHASYCNICVDITLRTKQLVDSGQSLVQIRAVIDAEFGGAGPGTDTARPQS